MAVLKKLFILTSVAIASLTTHSFASDKIQSHLSDNRLIIIDTESKKIIVYDTKSSKGLLLKEVRSFDKALESKDFSSKSGLSISDEKKHLK